MHWTCSLSLFVLHDKNQCEKENKNSEELWRRKQEKHEKPKIKLQ